MLCGLRGKIRERGKVGFAAESTQLPRPLVIRTRLVHGLACLRKRSVANAGAVGSRGCCLLGLRKFFVDLSWPATSWRTESGTRYVC